MLNGNGKIIAIIPARGGSKEIPKKNIVDFCGKPLLAWSILQARASQYIDGVYVSTNDPDIAEVARRYGAEVINRPEEISGDTATSESALLHAIDTIEKNGTDIRFVLFLQATSPLRETEDIDAAVNTMIKEGADSLFLGIQVGDLVFWKKNGDQLESINRDHKIRKRRQDYEYEPQYIESGSLWAFKPEILRANNNRLGGKIAMAPIAETRKMFEIDSKEDLELCRIMFQLNGLDKKNY